MPTLICDLRPQAAELIPEYHALREASEGVALYLPAAPPLPELSQVESAPALHAALDNEQIALLPQPLPAWLPLDDFHRVLLISDAASLTTPEQSLADVLLAQGCEAIEVLRPADALDLAQSWFSGRRTGTRVLR